MKKYLLLFLLLIPFSVKADVSAPTTVPYYVKPINNEVECVGNNNEIINLDENKSYRVDEYSYSSLYTKEITILYDDNNYCIVKTENVVGTKVDISENPEIKYEGITLPKSGLILREGPSKSFKKIVTIPQFSNIKFGVYNYIDTDEASEWLYVEYNGKKGWVFGGNEYVAEKIEETEAIVPSTWEATDLVTGEKYDIEAGSIIKTSYMTYNYVGTLSYAYVDEGENKYLVNALPKAKEGTYIITEEDTTVVTELSSYDKNNEVITIPKNTKVKVLYYKEYAVNSEVYVEYNERFGFVDTIDTIEFENKKENNNTLDQELENNKNIIIYTIIGVLVGVLITVIVMLLINKKKNKKNTSLYKTTNIALDVIESIQKEIDEDK